MIIQYHKIALMAALGLAMSFTFSCSSDGSVGSSKSNANININTDINTDITIDKRVIGTWISADGTTCVFNSDGTGKDKDGNFKYAFFSNKIVMSSKRYSKYIGSTVSTGVADYVFSTDGKTLIIYSPLGADWLTKKEQSEKEIEK